MEASERETVIQAATAERDEPLVRAAVGPGADPSHWWLRTAWLRHRNAIEDVHPLLITLQDARGTGFLTVEHVLTILDALNSKGRIRRWIEERPTILPARPAEDSQPRAEPAEARNETAEQSNATASETV